MKHLIPVLAILFCTGAFTGCMVSGGLVITPEPIVIGDPPPKKVGAKHKKYRQKSIVRVPPGHLPSRGMCRIWYTDRPPGHQPPQGNCRTLSRRVPFNAVLIRG